MRSLVREPVISVLAVAALAFGIGLPTAMYSLVDAMVLRGLPVEEPDEIVQLERRRVGASGEGFSSTAADLLAWQAGQQSFERLAGFTTNTATVRSDNRVDRRRMGIVTPSALTLVGAQPVLGRSFEESDGASGSPPVVAISESLWQDYFGGDRGVLGRSIFVDGESRTIVGVMPASLRFPDFSELWIPLPVDLAAANAEAPIGFSAFGRLRDGVSIEEASAEANLIAQRLRSEQPDRYTDMDITVKPFTERFVGEVATATLRFMLGAVLLVLLVACVNVASLLLVRAVHRVRDAAIRAALGASRGQLAMQLLTESAVLAIAGGIAGIALAYGLIALLRAGLDPTRLPYWAEIRLDPRVLLFALGTTCGAALLAAALPAFKTTRGDLARTLYDASRGSTGLQVGRVMRGIVVLEIALSLGLLIATGLLVRGVNNVRSIDLGAPSDQVLTARIVLPDDIEPEARALYYDALTAQLAALPGVADVALATALPATRGSFTRYAVEGEEYGDGGLPVTRRVVASSDLFEMFALAPMRGRIFDARDTRDGNPVVVVNANFARTHFGTADPIGRRIRLGDGTDDSQPWRTIVGVVPDLWIGGLDAVGDRNPSGIYQPVAQQPPLGMSLAVRTRAGGTADIEAVRRVAFALNPDAPVHDVKTLGTLITDNSWFYGLGAGIMGACGAAALLLASIGLYGVISFSVERRTREFGIRMALGATGRNIVTSVLRAGAPQIAIGLLLGFMLALLISRGISSLLFGVNPTDPLVFGGIGAVLIAVAVTATLVPSVRAAAIDPLEALRSE